MSAHAYADRPGGYLNPFTDSWFSRLRYKGNHKINNKYKKYVFNLLFMILICFYNIQHSNFSLQKFSYKLTPYLVGSASVSAVVLAIIYRA